MENLEQIITKLKSNEYELYTRFQEDEWGCRCLGDDTFLVWSKNHHENKDSERILSYSELFAYFSGYDLKALIQGLRKR